VIPSSGSSRNILREIDLHRLTTAQAERRAFQELHASRLRRESGLILVTGRGYGNRTQEPILRKHLQQWLKGPEAIQLGVLDVQVTSKGGALLVRISSPEAAR
jgi:DNA-nicking Smr family endonuclease